MIILRTKLEERDFSNSIDSFFGDSNTVINILLKILVMPGFDNGKYVEHWIENLAGSILYTINDIKIDNVNPGLAIPFLCVSLAQERGRYVNNLYKELKLSELKVPNYIQRIINEFFNGKYSRARVKFSKQDIDDFIMKIRYVALCLNDQVDENVKDWWDITRDKIDFMKQCPRLPDKDVLGEKLFSILCKINYDITLSSNLTKF